MTSLLGRLLRLFPESVPLEDLFTEAIARLFETRPKLCLAWLDNAELLSAARADRAGERYVRVRSQKSFAALENHDMDSRPDLLIEVHWAPKNDPIEGEACAEVVMVESKIGSGEGPKQLRRYAEHLTRMPDIDGKALLYVTRGYDPKDPNQILFGLDDNVRFKQARWHDFYRFLQTVEKDSLVEEMMMFMEEQGMASSHRFSTTDLIAISGVPRAFEIFDETLRGGEVKVALESFAGNKIRPETSSIYHIRTNGRYTVAAPLHAWDFQCWAGYEMRTPDSYPNAVVRLQTQPGWFGRDVSVEAMKRIALREGWGSYNLDNPADSAGVLRQVSLASLLTEEDHVAAVKRFFIETIRELKEELTAFKKERPELPWNGS